MSTQIDQLRLTAKTLKSPNAYNRHMTSHDIPKPWIRTTAWKLYFLFTVSMSALLERRPTKFQENYTTLQLYDSRNNRAPSECLSRHLYSWYLDNRCSDNGSSRRAADDGHHPTPPCTPLDGLKGTFAVLSGISSD